MEMHSSQALRGSEKAVGSEGTGDAPVPGPPAGHAQYRVLGAFAGCWSVCISFPSPYKSHIIKNDRPEEDHLSPIP